MGHAVHLPTELLKAPGAVREAPMMSTVHMSAKMSSTRLVGHVASNYPEETMSYLHHYWVGTPDQCSGEGRWVADFFPRSACLRSGRRAGPTPGTPLRGVSSGDTSCQPARSSGAPD